MTEQQLARKGGVENSTQLPSPIIIEARPVAVATPQASPELLELKNRHTIRLMLCCFLMVALGYSVHRCFSLIFFYLEHGHHISEAFLRWLCGATIAQIAIMLGVFVRAVWPRNDKKPQKSGKNGATRL